MIQTILEVCLTTVKAIFEDRAGILWLGTQAGLNRFDPKTEQFTVYRHDPQNPRQPEP